MLMMLSEENAIRFELLKSKVCPDLLTNKTDGSNTERRREEERSWFEREKKFYLVLASSFVFVVDF